MESIKNVEKMVRSILEIDVDSRNSDNVLYWNILDCLTPQRGTIWTAYDVFINGKELGLPNYETVRRARQKLQEKNPELRGSRRVQERRSDRERVFHGYACNG